MREVIEKRHAELAKRPDRDSWFAYAQILHAHAMEAQALAAYRMSSTLDPQRRFEPTYLAACIEEGSAPEAAFEHFGEALKLRQDYAPAWIRRGNLALLLGGLDAAREAFDRAAAIERSSHALFGQGRLALEEGHLDQARSLLEAALQADPRHHEVAASLAQVYRRLGLETRARALVDEAGSLDQKTAIPDPLFTAVMEQGVSQQNLTRLALLYLQVDDKAKALDYAEKAVAAGREAYGPQLARARVWARMGRTAEALAALEKLLPGRETDAEFIEELAPVLYQSGRAPEAIDRLEALLAVHADRIHARYLLGLFLVRARPAEAESHLRAVIARRPGHLDARCILAEVLAATGRVPEAQVELQRILEEAPGHRPAKELADRLAAH